MLWPDMLNNGPTRSLEATKELVIVYDKGASVGTVRNPWCVVAAEMSAGPLPNCHHQTIFCLVGLNLSRS